MTNFELSQILLEHGASLYSFVIVNNDKIKFDKIGWRHIMGSYPVWTKESIDKFITHLNNSQGINYIYNDGINKFESYGGYLQAYENRTVIAIRQRKLGKINYEIFKQRIAHTL